MKSFASVELVSLFSANCLQRDAILVAENFAEHSKQKLFDISLIDKQKKAYNFEERNAVELAKAYICDKNYRQAVGCFKKLNSQNNCSIFFFFYARYLELIKEHQTSTQDNSIDNESISLLMESFGKIYKDMEKCANSWKECAFSNYLFALLSKKVLRNSEGQKACIKYLVIALKLLPYFQSAWTVLLQNIKSLSKIDTLELPDNIFFHLFKWDCALKFKYATLAYEENEYFIYYGFENTYIYLKRMADTYQSLFRDFESAYPFYTKLFELFPNKIEYMKGYAEVLYLKGSLSELAYLARYCVVLNRDCFETCHVCANYYSLRSNPKEAIGYFQRSLFFNPYSVETWNCISQEYMELESIQASIKASKNALEISPQNPESHFNLGLAYELLNIHPMALHYFECAARHAPSNIKYLETIGELYDKMGRTDESLACLKKISGFQFGLESIKSLNKISEIYIKLGKHEMAANNYENLVESFEEVAGEKFGSEFPCLAQAHLFLAKYFLSTNDTKKFMHHVSKCARFPETKLQIHELVEKHLSSQEVQLSESLVKI